MGQTGNERQSGQQPAAEPAPAPAAFGFLGRFG